MMESNPHVSSDDDDERLLSDDISAPVINIKSAATFIERLKIWIELF